MHVLIVASAPAAQLEPYRALIAAADLVIAADGGASALLAAGVVPQIVIGDLDSIVPDDLARLEQAAIAIERHPTDKNETDLELALLLAVSRGATTIDVLGALGGRWDHTLANVALLALPELRGRAVRLLADQQELLLIEQHATIHGVVGETVSLLPFGGPAHGITTSGLRYPLHDATLALERSRGVSNVLTAPTAEVSLRTGRLLVVHHRSYSIAI